MPQSELSAKAAGTSVKASARVRSRDIMRFFILSSSLYDGDREHDVQRVHVLAVRCICGDFGEVFEREALLEMCIRDRIFMLFVLLSSALFAVNC